jgi:hypothetical protein
MPKDESKIYQVFVSSTFLDLNEVRAEVIRALTVSNFIPRVMETFLATENMAALDSYIKGVIDACDYYILILGNCCGTTREAKPGEIKSFTRIEFEHAVRLNKPMLCLQLEGITTASDRDKPAEPGSSQTKGDLLEDFIRYIGSTGKYVRPFNNPNRLVADIIPSLQHLVKTQPTTGLIKGSKTRPFDHHVTSAKYGIFQTEFQAVFKRATSTIMVAATDKFLDTIGNYLLSIVYALLRKVKVDVVCYRTEFTDTEEVRFKMLRLLKYLGCSIRISKRRPADYQAVFCDPHSPRTAKLIVIYPTEYDEEYLVYAESDHVVIEDIFKRFPRFSDTETIKPQIIALEDNKWYVDDVLRKRVPSYRAGTIKVQLLDFPLTDDRVLCAQQNEIKLFKLNQNSLAEDLFAELNLPLGRVLYFELSNKEKHLINPPILEARDGKYFIIDGHTRFYSAMKRRAETIFCAVVENCRDELPDEENLGSVEHLEPSGNYSRRETHPKGRHPRMIEKYTHRHDYHSGKWNLERFDFDDQKTFDDFLRIEEQKTAAG